MRRTLASLSVMAALLAGATTGEAADYTIDPTHSHILFTIDHLGFARMVGLFSDFSGNISFDANNVPASKVNVTIKTDSLQTQFAPRDKDLKGADWFNVTEFPEMSFVGTDFVKKDDHTAPRDKDLKGADWFNVTEFPEMSFVGTDFVKK